MRARDTQETLRKRTALKPSTDFSFLSLAARASVFRDDDEVRLFLFSQFFCFASTVIPCRGFIRGGVGECCAREETVCVGEKSVGERRDERVCFRPSIGFLEEF